MAITIDPNSVSEYRLKDDTSGAVFLVRPLTSREFARHVAPGLDAAGGSGRFVLGEAGIEVLRCGLAGWRGVVDAAGAAVPFADEPGTPRRVATDATVDRLGLSVRMELVGEILRLSRISEDDRRD